MQGENKNERSSMFTVRNAENAMIVFTIFALFVLIVVFLHEFVLKRNGFVNSLYTIAYNISKIMSAATLLTIFEEVFDMMFSRFRAVRAREKELKKLEEEAIAAARTEGYEKGYEEGYAKGKAENRDEGNESPKSEKKPSE